MKSLSIFLVALLCLGGCARENSKQRALFTEATRNEVAKNDATAADLYREAAAMDPSTKLAQDALAALDRLKRAGDKRKEEAEAQLAR